MKDEEQKLIFRINDTTIFDLQLLFFELIRVSIGVSRNLSKPPTNEEWKALYDMAKNQSLVGVCFAGVRRLQLQKHCPKEILYLTWMGVAAKIQQRNEVVNRQCVDLQMRLAADGMSSSVLKGQGVAQMYSEHLRGLRQSGDIDVIVDAPKDVVIRYVKSHCPDVRTLMSHHIDFPVFEDTMVEMHYLPAQLCNPFTQRRLVKWYENRKDNAFSNISDNGITTPNIEFNLVFLLLHIYKHLFAEGIGLRQCMDYYFVLCSVKNVESFDKIRIRVKEVVSELGMNRFASALMWVLGRVFGLTCEQMLWEPDEKEGRWLLDDIMRNGNMGHGRENWIKPSDSAWFRFWKISSANLRMLVHYPSETLWFPYFKLWHYPWRKWMEKTTLK